MTEHKKKKKHPNDGPLPGYGFREVVVFAPSRPPAGCDGHPQCNQIAGNVGSGSVPPASSSPASGGSDGSSAPSGGDAGGASSGGSGDAAGGGAPSGGGA